MGVEVLPPGYNPLDISAKSKHMGIRREKAHQKGHRLKVIRCLRRCEKSTISETVEELFEELVDKSTKKQQLENKREKIRTRQITARKRYDGKIIRRRKKITTGTDSREKDKEGFWNRRRYGKEHKYRKLTKKMRKT